MARGWRVSVGRPVGAGLIAAAAAALLCGAALASSTPTISLKAKPAIVNFQAPKPTTSNISGRLSSGKSGVTVALQRRIWPFSAAFGTVAHHKTQKNGTFSFKQQPSLATQYRVVAPKAGITSATRTVYVMPGYDHLACTFSGPGGTYVCNTKTRPPAGTYTIHFSYDYLYPASAYATEKGKPVYVYFGERVGANKHPSTLSLQGTVSQHPAAGNTTHVKITHKLTIPTSAYRWQLETCTKTSEKLDGMGLPGLPGSHHCGQATITWKQSQHHLG